MKHLLNSTVNAFYLMFYGFLRETFQNCIKMYIGCCAYSVNRHIFHKLPYLIYIQSADNHVIFVIKFPLKIYTRIEEVSLDKNDQYVRSMSLFVATQST